MKEPGAGDKSRGGSHRDLRGLIRVMVVMVARDGEEDRVSNIKEDKTGLPWWRSG